jgi:hypothetical protein
MKTTQTHGISETDNAKIKKLATDWLNKTPESDNQRNETRLVCPSCDQWQHDNLKGYYDCFHQCAELGYTRRIPTPAAPAQAQHSPLGGLNVEVAKSKRWPGYTWQDYQTAIVRQNHHISKVEAHAQRLADALAEMLSEVECFCADYVANKKPCPVHQAREALAEWSKSI